MTRIETGRYWYVNHKMCMHNTGQIREPSQQQQKKEEKKTASLIFRTSWKPKGEILDSRNELVE